MDSRRVAEVAAQNRTTEVKTLDSVTATATMSNAVQPTFAESIKVASVDEVVIVRRLIEMTVEQSVTHEERPGATLTEAVVSAQQARKVMIPDMEPAIKPTPNVLVPFAATFRPETVEAQSERSDDDILMKNLPESTATHVDIVVSTNDNDDTLADFSKESTVMSTEAPPPIDDVEDTIEDPDDTIQFEADRVAEAADFKPRTLLRDYVSVNFESVQEATTDDELEPATVFKILPDMAPAAVVESLTTHLEAMPVTELVEASAMVSRMHILQERLTIIADKTDSVEYAQIAELIEATGNELIALLHIDCEPSLQKQFVRMLVEQLQSGDYALLNDASHVDEGTHEMKDFGRLLNLLKDAARNMQAKLQHYLALGKSALMRNVPALT